MINLISKYIILILSTLKYFRLQLKLRINLIAISLCATFSFFWMILAAKRYYFLYAKDYWDLAFQARNVWVLLHGSFYNTLIGANFPAEHCMFISSLLMPFYWLFPDPILLQYFKIGAFFLGAYIFFLLLKKKLHPFIALLAMLAYTIAPANIAMLRHIFNNEPFSIPLVFLIFKSLEDRNYPLYIISCFLLTMVKEQMPLVVIMFSVLAFFLIKTKRFKWVWTPFLMGITIFILDVFIITPFCRKDCPITQSFYWHRYAQFGRSPIEIFYYIFTHPLNLLTQLTTSLNVTWYKDLFGIWGILSFLSPQLLLPASALFLKLLLSNENCEHVVTVAWYASTFTPFIYLATWNTLNHIRNRWRFFIHFIVIMVMLLHAFNYWPKWMSLFNTPIGNNAIIYKRMIDQIPPHSIVCGDFYSLSFLANQKGLYSMGAFLTGNYYISERKFFPDMPIDHFLINFLDKEAGLADLGSRKTMIPKITKLNFDNHWKLIDSIEDIALYEKNGTDLPLLVVPTVV